MGFRLRKSFKIGPVRVSLGKRGIGVSTGVKGARISVNTSGRTTTTVGIPGTGISYQSVTSSWKNRQRQRQPQKEIPVKYSNGATSGFFKFAKAFLIGFLLLFSLLFMLDCLSK